MKIKILKRQEQPVIKEEKTEIVPVPASASVAELTRKISTSLELKETDETSIVEEPPKKPSKIKIVYSSASKTLQKM